MANTYDQNKVTNMAEAVTFQEQQEGTTSTVTVLETDEQRLVFQDSPLNGVRILDLTRIVAGPYCTMILSDLGAEVLKIERPGTGDEARKWGPPFINDTPEASPHLIYCSITGYGSEGPYKKRPGYDVIAASEGGLLHITGPKDGEPVKPGVAVTDLATGLYAHGAIMAALIKRSRTGRGQKIDCNLLSTQVASLINIGSNYLNASKEASRWGTAHESIVPYEAFPSKDGYFTIGTGSDLQFEDLCRRIELPELSKNEKYASNKLRVKHREELIAIIRAVLKKKSNKEWSEIFNGSICPNGPVNSLRETFDDPHIKAIGLVENVAHPVAGDIKVVGPAVKYSEGGNLVRSPPPTLGQHTDDVLHEVLGLSNEEIDILRDKQVIQ
ncbi:hypothetical protein NQ318_003307 [Aromia moschata]|uniref:Uncharacterized protein n=1 Tax=Aromia moschata TaxID=1265417 RepID=A0AAV8YL94_9CUCU|nr:hypothetical protein NQ318_003307 [Aromia moschata]